MAGALSEDMLLPELTVETMLQRQGNDPRLQSKPRQGKGADTRCFEHRSGLLLKTCTPTRSPRRNHELTTIAVPNSLVPLALTSPFLRMLCQFSTREPWNANLVPWTSFCCEKMASRLGGAVSKWYLVSTVSTASAHGVGTVSARARVYITKNTKAHSVVCLPLPVGVRTGAWCPCSA